MARSWSTPRRRWCGSAGSGWSWTATRCSRCCSSGRRTSDEQPEMTLLDVLKLAARGRGRPGMGARSGLARDAQPPARQERLRPDRGARCACRARCATTRSAAWPGCSYLETLGLNPCLADDMGLGKTIQVIAHLLNERADGATSVPADAGDRARPRCWATGARRSSASRRTCARWSTRAARGPKRSVPSRRPARDTTWSSPPSPWRAWTRSCLRGVTWRRVVVDEAQNIKNPQAAQTRAILKLPAHASAGPDRHAGRESPARPVVDLQLPQSRLPGQGGAVPQELRGADPEGQRPGALGDPEEAGRAVHPAPRQDRQAHHRRPAGQDRAEDVLQR